MSDALVINAVFPVDILRTEIKNKLVMDVALKKALKLFNRKDIHILCDIKGTEYIKEKYNAFNIFEIKERSLFDVLPLVYNRLKGYDNIVYLYADEPLIDINATKKLISLHKEEFADYSYGEGFVRGALPEVLSAEILPRLALLDKDKDYKIDSKEAIFNLLSKDINSFDIETLFSDKDLRLMRFELTTSEKRNRMIVERLASMNKGFDISYDDICETIEKNPEIVRTVPSYIEVELTDKVRYIPPYLPINAIKRERGEMELENYKALLKLLSGFTDHFYISISYLGEPLLHPDIKAIIKNSLKNDNISLILETDGIDFTPEFSNFIIDLNSDNINIIFQLDAIKNDTYQKIHGTDIKYVERNIRYLLSRMKKNVYVQMVRMDMNEDEMLDFYNTWESEGAGVIIQKYNNFLGILPELSSVDLKPLEKICCYHLMREMVIFYNGDVPRCKQDINAKYLLGNIYNKSIEEVWGKGESHFKNYCNEKFDEDCRKCDEYYIFNF